MLYNFFLFLSSVADQILLLADLCFHFECDWSKPMQSRSNDGTWTNRTNRREKNARWFVRVVIPILVHVDDDVRAKLLRMRFMAIFFLAEILLLLLFVVFFSGICQWFLWCTSAQFISSHLDGVSKPSHFHCSRPNFPKATTRSDRTEPKPNYSHFRWKFCAMCSWPVVHSSRSHPIHKRIMRCRSLPCTSAHRFWHDGNCRAYDANDVATV